MDGMDLFVLTLGEDQDKWVGITREILMIFRKNFLMAQLWNRLPWKEVVSIVYIKAG